MPPSSESTHQSSPPPSLGGQPAASQFAAPASPLNGAPVDGEPTAPINGEHAPRNGVHPAPAVDGAPGEGDAGEHAQMAPMAQEGASQHAVRIRGRPGGVAVEIGDGDWEPLLELLEERLAAADGFFRGGRVMLAVGARSLHQAQLEQVSQIFAQHEMRLAVVASTEPSTVDAAVAIGVTTTEDADESELPVAVAPLAPPPKAAPSPPPVAPRVPEPLPPQPQHYVHRGSLRSGQILRKTESVVIIGDVNPGAQVISGGDIMVWGRLRGIAHAGADGNRHAVVAALDFVPTQLRIAKLTTIPPEQKRGRGLFFWRKQPARRPEIARILDGKIIVEPWDETRTYGTSALRR